MKVFFDVDGVVIDGWHVDSALRKPWDADLEADLGVDRTAFEALFFSVPDGRESSRMVDCITGQRDLRDALAEVLPRVGYDGSAEAFMRYWFEKDSNVNTAVLNLVRQIRERSAARVYLATGQEHHRARYLWNDLGLSKHFDGMFYSAEIGHTKTDARFFAAIDSALDIDAEERPIFFDDAPEIVAIARGAGWDATAFTSTADIRDHARLRHLWSQHEAS